MKTHSAASTILTMIAQPYPTSVSTTMCLILEEISGIERERVIFFFRWIRVYARERTKKETKGAVRMRRGSVFVTKCVRP